MTRFSILSSLIVACGLALAAPSATAQAQQDPELEYDYDELEDYDEVEEWEEEPVVPREGVVPRGEIERDIARRGMATGVVTGLDLHHGRVVLQTREGRVMLFATPSQVAQLQLGQQFSGRVMMIEQRPWLVEDMAPRPEELRRFGQAGTIRARITRVDRGAGTVTIMTPRGETVQVRSHPHRLRQLRQGQTVMMRYQMVGDAIWAPEIGTDRRQPQRFPQQQPDPHHFDDEMEWGAPQPY